MVTRCGAQRLRLLRAVSALAVGVSVAAAAQRTIDVARVEQLIGPCQACHGGETQLPQSGVPTLVGQNSEFLVLQMFYMREGLRDVPQMSGVLKGYTDRDLEDVAAYLAGKSALKATGNRDAALHARGAELSKAMGCGSCHFPDYRGQKHVPRLTHQREDYLVTTLKAYRDNKRTGTDTSMNAAMYRATDAEIAALAHYLAHQ